MHIIVVVAASVLGKEGPIVVKQGALSVSIVLPATVDVVRAGPVSRVALNCVIKLWSRARRV